MKQLQLTFKNEAGKKQSLSLDYANQTLDEASAKTAMAKISALRLFNKDGIGMYDQSVGAKYVERNETTIF